MLFMVSLKGVLLAAFLVLVGILFLVYGVSVMMVQSGTWFFAVWYVIGAACITAGLVVHVGLWDAMPAVLKRFVQALTCMVLLVLVVTQGCALGSFGARGEDNLDYVIVLGAQVRESGPSAVLRYRLDEAYDYLQANPETICIVSGGQGPNESIPEAHGMAEYLENRGLDPSRIIVEDRSLTTYQNIRNSMQLFDSETARVGIVTNNFHVFRAVHIARKQGIAHACGIAAPSNTWYLPNNLLRESFGITKDLLRGNL